MVRRSQSSAPYETTFQPAIRTPVATADAKYSTWPTTSGASVLVARSMLRHVDWIPF